MFLPSIGCKNVQFSIKVQFRFGIVHFVVLLDFDSVDILLVLLYLLLSDMGRVHKIVLEYEYEYHHYL